MLVVLYNEHYIWSIYNDYNDNDDDEALLYTTGLQRLNFKFPSAEVHERKKDRAVYAPVGDVDIHPLFRSFRQTTYMPTYAPGHYLIYLSVR